MCGGGEGGWHLHLKLYVEFVFMPIVCNLCAEDSSFNVEFYCCRGIAESYTENRFLLFSSQILSSFASYQPLPRNWCSVAFWVLGLLVTPNLRNITKKFRIASVAHVM